MTVLFFVFPSLSAFALPKPFQPNRSVYSTHFRVYHEEPYAPAGVLNVLEGLHAKLMLDLQPFAPWTESQPIALYIYKDEESYHRNSGAPAWAGGHADLAGRAVHVYESAQFQRVMAHELGHLFFDGYFAEKKTAPPLWLTEGVATLMEWDYGLDQEQAARDGAGGRAALSLADFLRVNYRHDQMSFSSTSQWYWQASSLTRFLMRRFPQAQFVAFCSALRAGEGLDPALMAGYGWQVPDAAALERLWNKSLNESR